jgi:hypothetical protein
VEVGQWMAMYRASNDSRGNFEQDDWDDQGILRGYFVPTSISDQANIKERVLDIRIKIMEADSAKNRLTIFPIKTEDGMSGNLGPKYAQITQIILPTDLEGTEDLRDVLENVPDGISKAPEYGLGLTRLCTPLIALIERQTSCTTIVFESSGEPRGVGDRFVMPLDLFNKIRSELDRIGDRGRGAVSRVRETYVHNQLANTFNVPPKSLSLGRLADSQWIAKIAEGAEPLNTQEQNALVSATAKAAYQIASDQPQKLSELQRDIQVVNLDRLITEYGTALERRHPEGWWQVFFEKNIFALQLLFGGPTAFIDSQTHVGDETKVLKGRKIIDYLMKNELTANAAIVEIKTPHTPIISASSYRTGTYKIPADIGGAVVQVLDQARKLIEHENPTKDRTDDHSWKSIKPRCFVVAGLTTELDNESKLYSFELFRETLGSVRLVTFDEILGQIRVLRDFLANETDQ